MTGGKKKSKRDGEKKKEFQSVSNKSTALVKLRAVIVACDNGQEGTKVNGCFPASRPLCIELSNPCYRHAVVTSREVE